MSYKVKKGDTLSKIAKNHGISLSELIKLNGFSKDQINNLRIGQEIKLSDKSYMPQYTFSSVLTPKQSNAKSDIRVPFRNSKESVRTLQQQLIDAKFNLGKWGADGVWGKTSQAALDKALAAGYTLVNGRLIKPTSSAKPELTSKSSVRRVFESMGNMALGSMGAYSAGIKSNAKEPAKKPTEKDLQEQLIKVGYNVGRTGADGKWGKNSQAALDKALADGYKLENGVLVAPKKPKTSIFSFDNPVLKKVSSDAAQYATNFVKSPTQATVDAVLYIADIAGAPTNATNYLRDLNVSLPYRAKSAIRAGFNTIMGNKSWEENYANALANPGLYTRATTIQPLTNTNYNFSDEELAVLREMAGSDFQITNEDIRRVSEDKRYGHDGSIRSYFTPTKVVQTAIGQSSGDPTTGTITDVFDVNTVGEAAKKDNATYKKIAQENNSFGYADLRASLPIYNMIDIIPDRFKIHTKVKHEK